MKSGKRHGYAPDRWYRWWDLALAGLAIVAVLAALSVAAFGQPGDPRPLLTVEALSRVQPSPEPPDRWLGAVYRHTGRAVFFFRPEEGDVALLGVAPLPVAPAGIGWPFLRDPAIDALPVFSTPWGFWRLPELPVWYVFPGETLLPLPAGPAVVQPAFLRWGPPTTLRIGIPLILPP